MAIAVRTALTTESTKLTPTLQSESVTDWHGSCWAQDRLTKIWEVAPKPLPGRGPEGTLLTHTWLAEGQMNCRARHHSDWDCTTCSNGKTVNLTTADISVRDLTVLFPNVLSTRSSNRKNSFHTGSHHILQKKTCFEGPEKDSSLLLGKSEWASVTACFNF